MPRWIFLFLEDHDTSSTNIDHFIADCKVAIAVLLSLLNIYGAFGRIMSAVALIFIVVQNNVPSSSFDIYSLS